MLTKSFKVKILSDSLFLTVSDLLMKLKGLIFIPFAVRFLGLEQYGSYVQIIINVSLVASLCQLSLGQAFYRYTSRYDSHEKAKIGQDYWSIFSLTIILACLGTVCLYSLSQLISDHILDGQSLDAVRVSSLLVLTESFWSVNNKFIQSRGELKLFSILQIIYEFVRFLTLIAGVVLWETLLAGLALYFTAAAIMNLLILPYIISKTGFYAPSAEIMLKYIKFTLPLTASGASVGLLARMDRYFIGYFWGPATIGIYSIIYSLCQILEHLSIPFTKYFQIFIPRLWDNNQKERVINQLKYGLKLYLALSVGTIFLFAYLSRPLISWLLGKDLSYIVNFEYVTLLVGFGVVASGATSFFFHLSLYWEKPYMQLVLQFIGLAANGVLNYFLISNYALVGAGFATFISYLLIIALCFFVFRLDFGWNYGFRVLAILASGFAMVLILDIQGTASIVVTLMKGMAAATLYLSLIFALRVLTVQELKNMWS